VGAAAAASADELVARPDVDAVIVAVPHHLTRDLATMAFDAGKHVFCEKPLGRNVAECDDVLAAQARSGRVLGVGFNYRHYPGMTEARRLIEAGAIGEPTHLRFTLGHAGRPGYEAEWKTSKELCGGGALFDPGIHALDLVRFLLGPIESGSITLFRSFWEIDVEDNAFVWLRTEQGRQAQLHISITEWRNELALDILGRDGSLRIRGRSGFYGRQSLELTKRWSWLSEERKGEEIVRTYPHEDSSFEVELRQFLDRVEGRTTPDLADADDARSALVWIERLYDSAPAAARESDLAIAGPASVGP
jgi:predicted dehydrogenase